MLKIFLHGTENVPRGTREPGGRSRTRPRDAGRSDDGQTITENELGFSRLFSSTIELNYINSLLRSGDNWY